MCTCPARDSFPLPPATIPRGRSCLRRTIAGARLFPCSASPDGIGPPGTKIAGSHGKRSAPISNPGTILSQMPSSSAASNVACESDTAVLERDHIAREQRQLHALKALRDAVAHRRHAARDLRDRADLARRFADDVGITLVRRVRREHVVVGGDDADIRPLAAEQHRSCPARRSRPSCAPGWLRQTFTRAGSVAS